MIISIFVLNTLIQSGSSWNICKRAKKEKRKKEEKTFLFFNNCLISKSILEKNRWMFESVCFETLSLQHFVLFNFIF